MITRSQVKEAIQIADLEISLHESDDRNLYDGGLIKIDIKHLAALTRAAAHAKYRSASGHDVVLAIQESDSDYLDGE